MPGAWVLLLCTMYLSNILYEGRVEGMGGSVVPEIRICVEGCVEKIGRQTLSRARRAANVLRNAELHVLAGQRSGKVYKKPGTYGKTRTKATRQLVGEYGHKLMGGQLYRASAPGEPPAKRLGDLKGSFVPYVEGTPGGADYTIRAGIKSDLGYASTLEEGSTRVAPRPYRGPILERARPEIEKIFDEPYKL